MDATTAINSLAMSHDTAQKRARLIDVGSTNGTFVNHTVLKNTAAELKPGDIIRFGFDPIQYRFDFNETTNERHRPSTGISSTPFAMDEHDDQNQPQRQQHRIQSPTAKKHTQGFAEQTNRSNQQGHQQTEYDESSGTVSESQETCDRPAGLSSREKQGSGRTSVDPPRLKRDPTHEGQGGSTMNDILYGGGYGNNENRMSDSAKRNTSPQSGHKNTRKSDDTSQRSGSPSARSPDLQRSADKTARETLARSLRNNSDKSPAAHSSTSGGRNGPNKSPLQTLRGRPRVSSEGKSVPQAHKHVSESQDAISQRMARTSHKRTKSSPPGYADMSKRKEDRNRAQEQLREMLRRDRAAQRKARLRAASAASRSAMEAASNTMNELHASVERSTGNNVPDISVLYPSGPNPYAERRTEEDAPVTTTTTTGAHVANTKTTESSNFNITKDSLQSDAESKDRGYSEAADVPKLAGANEQEVNAPEVPSETNHSQKESEVFGHVSGTKSGAAVVDHVEHGRKETSGTELGLDRPRNSHHDVNEDGHSNSDFKRTRGKSANRRRTTSNRKRAYSSPSRNSSEESDIAHDEKGASLNRRSHSFSDHREALGSTGRDGIVIKSFNGNLILGEDARRKFSDAPTQLLGEDQRANVLTTAITSGQYSHDVQHNPTATVEPVHKLGALSHSNISSGVIDYHPISQQSSAPTLSDGPMVTATTGTIPATEFVQPVVTAGVKTEDQRDHDTQSSKISSAVATVSNDGYALHHDQPILTTTTQTNSASQNNPNKIDRRAQQLEEEKERMRAALSSAESQVEQLQEEKESLEKELASRLQELDKSLERERSHGKDVTELMQKISSLRSLAVATSQKAACLLLESVCNRVKHRNVMLMYHRWRFMTVQFRVKSLQAELQSLRNQASEDEGKYQQDRQDNGDVHQQERSAFSVRPDLSPSKPNLESNQCSVTVPSAEGTPRENEGATSKPKTGDNRDEKLDKLVNLLTKFFSEETEESSPDERSSTDMSRSLESLAASSGRRKHSSVKKIARHLQKAQQLIQSSDTDGDDSSSETDSEEDASSPQRQRKKKSRKSKKNKSSARQRRKKKRRTSSTSSSSAASLPSKDEKVDRSRSSDRESLNNTSAMDPAAERSTHEEAYPSDSYKAALSRELQRQYQYKLQAMMFANSDIPMNYHQWPQEACFPPIQPTEASEGKSTYYPYPSNSYSQTGVRVPPQYGAPLPPVNGGGRGSMWHRTNPVPPGMPQQSLHKWY